jgi:survival-of-motor-neuron-related-splicing factor 30
VVDEMPKWLEIKPTGRRPRDLRRLSPGMLGRALDVAAPPNLPSWPGGAIDDDKTKSKKKKLQKSYKSKLRFQKMDSQQKNKAEAWRSFVSGKGTRGGWGPWQRCLLRHTPGRQRDQRMAPICRAGSKKKAGFLTGTKKESIFRVPEGYKGKVGVVGSGQGMTDYQKRKRHEFDTLAGGDGL